MISHPDYQSARAAILARKDLSPAQRRAAFGLLDEGKYGAVKIYLNRYCPVKPPAPPVPPQQACAAVFLALNALQQPVNATPETPAGRFLARGWEHVARKEATERINALGLPPNMTATLQQLLANNEFGVITAYLNILTK